MTTFGSNPAEQLMLRSLSDSETAQRNLLLSRLVGPNQSCEFGRKHSFSSIRSVSDFQRAVPVCGYEESRDDVERIADGEQGILTSEPVRRLFITSGSLGMPKYIPVTASFILDKWRVFQTFWSLVRQTYPGADRGNFIFNFSDAGNKQCTKGGLLCSAETSFWNACWRGTAGTGKCPIPPEIMQISSAEARYYTIARVLLETEVSVLMTLNPSTMLLLFEVVQQNAERLLADIANGGLSLDLDVDDEIRKCIAGQFKGNRARADQLRRILSGREPVTASTLWPNLQLVVCWRSPMVRPYLEILHRFVGDVPQRDYLSMASEGILAVPFQNEISGGYLPIHTHFYEFVPEELAEDNAPPTLLAHQLDVGRSYIVVLSTSSGLYRYNIGDVVKVRGFLGSTPVLEFLHRYGHTCSLTGEKLTESQVAGAVCDAASKLGFSIQSFTLCPVPQPYPHYVLLVEMFQSVDPRLFSKFLMEVDQDLGRQNIEYQSKRSSRRLGALELCILPAGSYASLRRQRIVEGANDAQVKVPCLTRELDFFKRFQALERVSCESAA